MLTIATFKWGTKYSMEHVRRLHSMLRRNLTIPFNFVLISDQVDEDMRHLIGDFDRGFPTRVIPLWDEMREAKLCGVRLMAFSPWMRELIGPRFAWVDLDVVIMGNVDHVFGRKEAFIALSTPQGPLAYNGSLVMMSAGARSRVWETWTPAAYDLMPAHYAAKGMIAGGQSDEGWMTYALGTGEARLNGGWGRRDDGIYFFRHDLKGGAVLPPHDARMIVMNGRRFDPSNAEAQRLPWVRQNWR